VKAIRTSAKRDGEGWVLKGTKMFITNGALADVLFVARRRSRRREEGLSMFIVEKGTRLLGGPQARQGSFLTAFGRRRTRRRILNRLRFLALVEIGLALRTARCEQSETKHRNRLPSGASLSEASTRSQRQFITVALEARQGCLGWPLRFKYLPRAESDKI